MTRYLPLGDQALLLSVPDPLAWATALDQAALRGVVDLVPAKESLLVVFDPAATSFGQLRAQLRRLAIQPGAARSGREHTIPVRYDGPDLAEVAGRCQLTVAALVALHSQALYTVALIGFLPGFPYLDGLPARLHLPRRASPRTKVPAGAIAIAGAQTGIYPQASPGGWHILGTTASRLFDTDQWPPALLSAGDTVRFMPVE
jgi:KipI family sensor histidine kinase inhibitor